MMQAQEENRIKDNALTDDCESDDYALLKDTASLSKDENGTWHWTYVMDLSHNDSFLRFLMRVILVPCALVFGVILLFAGLGGSNIRSLLMAYGILMAVLGFVTVLIWLMHLLTAKLFDNSYFLHYEMNENGIAFVQGKERSVSEFRRVRTVRIEREHRRILLNTWFLYNMICCDSNDFDFVADYIVKRCTHAIIIRK